jgi:long-chain acyl-CoA synthetase
MMHAIGLGGDLLPAISLGIPAVLLPAFTPGAALDAVENFCCRYTLGLPALLHFVVDEQIRMPRDASSLRTVLAAGDRVPVKLQERFAAVFGVPLQEAIGLTETFPIAFNPKGAIRPGSLGVPDPLVKLAIVDLHDRELPDGEIGEIVVRSPANCAGYWNDPAATDALLRNGWMHTGDWDPAIPTATSGSGDAKRTSSSVPALTFLRRKSRASLSAPSGIRSRRYRNPGPCLW